MKAASRAKKEEQHVSKVSHISLEAPMIPDSSAVWLHLLQEFRTQAKVKDRVCKFGAVSHSKLDQPTSAYCFPHDIYVVNCGAAYVNKSSQRRMLRHSYQHICHVENSEDL